MTIFNTIHYTAKHQHPNSHNTKSKSKLISPSKTSLKALLTKILYILLVPRKICFGQPEFSASVAGTCISNQIDRIKMEIHPACQGEIWNIRQGNKLIKRQLKSFFNTEFISFFDTNIF